MKKTSAFQIALLCTFGGLAIAGVLIFSLFVSKGTTSSIGSVTIWGTFDENTFQKTLTDQAVAQPDLLNAHYVQKDAANYVTDLTNALASGKAPDLFFITQDQAYSQRDRVIAIPLSKYSVAQFGSLFIDGALPFTGTDGTLAFPIVVDPLVLYWNKDLLANGGYSQPPKYWDEMLALAQQLTLRRSDGTLQRSTIALGTYSNVDHAKEILSMLISQAGGRVTARGQNNRLASALMASSTGLLSVPSALRFYTEFADPSNEYYTWNRSLPSSMKAFAGGTLALYLGHSSEQQSIAEANPNLNFAVASVPQIRGVAAQSDAGIVYGLSIPKTAKNPSGAYVIMQLLASKDAAALIANALGLPSARRDVLTDQRKQGNLQLAATEAILVRSWEDPNPTKTDSIFRAMIEDTTSGATLLSEAISRAELQIDNLIGS